MTKSKCVYIKSNGQRCRASATTPRLHGFLSQQQLGKQLTRSRCYEFTGGLCKRHYQQLVVPPREWWSASGAQWEMIGV